MVRESCINKNAKQSVKIGTSLESGVPGDQ